MQAVLGNFVMVLFTKIIVFCSTISYNKEKYLFGDYYESKDYQDGKH